MVSLLLLIRLYNFLFSFHLFRNLFDFFIKRYYLLTSRSTKENTRISRNTLYQIQYITIHITQCIMKIYIIGKKMDDITPKLAKLDLANTLWFFAQLYSKVGIEKYLDSILGREPWWCSMWEISFLFWPGFVGRVTEFNSFEICLFLSLSKSARRRSTLSWSGEEWMPFITLLTNWRLSLVMNSYKYRMWEMIQSTYNLFADRHEDNGCWQYHTEERENQQFLRVTIYAKMSVLCVKVWKIHTVSPL